MNIGLLRVRYGGGHGRDALLILWGLSGDAGALAIRSAEQRVGGGAVVDFFRHASPSHPHAGLDDTVVFDPRRRRPGHHQHWERPSPPKLQPRVAAGATIRAAEAQWSAGDCSGGEGKV